MSEIDYSNYKNLVVGANTMIPIRNNAAVTAVNFDNAATTPPFVSVMQKINAFAPWYSSIHRGTGYKSKLSSDIYEEARVIIADFVKADPTYHSIIFVKNTTEAINQLSNCLFNGDKKNIVLSTYMEHHSNDLPWRNNFQTEYVHIEKNGTLSLEDLEKKLCQYRGNVKLVAVTGASNVTGYINPIHEIAAIAHKHGAKIFVDGAQLVPHKEINMGPIDDIGHIDYLAFSAHKMYAPFGVGVLIGPRKLFEKKAPDYKGGGTVKTVTHDRIIWADSPERNEAGTPNVMGVMALIESINTIKLLKMKNIDNYELYLTRYLLDKLKSVPDIKIYGGTEATDSRMGIVPFNIADMPHDIVASILSEESGIAVRNGCFCAQPYIQQLLNLSKEDIRRQIRHPKGRRPGMVRISFGLYNDTTEIDRLIQMLHNITYNKTAYKTLYNI